MPHRPDDGLLADKRPLIYRIAGSYIRRHGWFELDDAVQIVSVAAWTVLNDPRHDGKDAHRVASIIANESSRRLTDELRSGRVNGITRTAFHHGDLGPLSLDAEDEEGAAGLLEALPSEEAGYRHVDDADEVDWLLARLPERERFIVWLYYFEHLTLREIGEIVGVNESRTCQILEQARQRMRGPLAA
jgi:RNA polymerase sigma factor (sigma-70 family)